MDEMKKLYSERKMMSLLKLCRRECEAGKENVKSYGYWACAQAARNDLTSLTLAEGIQMFEKAAGLCSCDEEKTWLFEIFGKEVLQSIRRAMEEFGIVTRTPEVVAGYRSSMQYAADGLLAVGRLGEQLSHADVLSVKKEAAACMIQLCAVQKYEVDMGKYVLKQVDNAPGEIREKYAELYDQTVAEIREADRAYIPAEIQREYVAMKESGEAEIKGEEAEMGEESGEKDIGRIRRLLKQLFRI